MLGGLLSKGAYEFLSSSSIEQKSGLPGSVVTSPLPSSRPPSAAQHELTMRLIGQREGDQAHIVLNEGDALQSGDRFLVKYKTTYDAYIYILMLDSQGEVIQLFPDPKIHISNKTGGGQEYQVPSGSQWFGLDEALGIETVYAIASRKPLQNISKLVASLNTVSRKYLASHSSSEPNIVGARLRLRGTSGLVKGESPLTKTADTKLIQVVTEYIEKAVPAVKAVSFHHQ